MANKRMFSSKIIESADFLNMPHSTQNLYIHLGMNADDDGILNNSKIILRMAGCKRKDYQKLIDNEYIIELSENLCAIKHWKINNTLRGDRYNPTIYPEALKMLGLKGKEYVLISVHNDNQNDNQSDNLNGDTRLPQNNINKDNINKERTNEEDVCLIYEDFCSKLATEYPIKRFDKETAFPIWKKRTEEITEDRQIASNKIGRGIWLYIQQYKESRNEDGELNFSYIPKLSNILSKDFECAEKVQYVKNTYKDNTPEQKAKIEEATKKADAEISRLRVEAAKDVIEDAERIKETEAKRMALIDAERLDKIRAISELPLSASEIKALNDNFGIDDYWCGRAIGELAEKNAVSQSEVGIIPSYDVKMDILNQCLNNFNNFIINYEPNLNGKMKSAEQLKMEVGVSADVLNRAYEIYAGEYLKETVADMVSKALMHLATKKTDIEKGLIISNVLNNVKNNKDALNKLLCEISLDNNISDLAIEMSGYSDEIRSFKNEKAADYKKAEAVLDGIRKSKDEDYIEMQIATNRDNEFFAGMMLDESKRNNTVLPKVSAT